MERGFKRMSLAWTAQRIGPCRGEGAGGTFYGGFALVVRGFFGFGGRSRAATRGALRGFVGGVRTEDRALPGAMRYPRSMIHDPFKGGSLHVLPLLQCGRAGPFCPSGLLGTGCPRDGLGQDVPATIVTPDS